MGRSHDGARRELPHTDITVSGERHGQVWRVAPSALRPRTWHALARREEESMLRATIRYARYALSMLSGIGFGTNLN